LDCDSFSLLLVAALEDHWPHPQSTRDPIQNIDTCRVKVTLERTDVRAVDLGTMRELFLRDASHPPKLSQIECQYLSDIHIRERSGLKSISPRSIFYKARSDEKCRPVTAFVELG
jgi:hypothetical protein